MLRIIILTSLFVCGVTGFTQKSADTVGEENEEVIKDRMPQFTGGDNAFYDYLDKNVLLPKGFDGVAYMKEHGNQFVPISVTFTIDIDGSIINVKVVGETNKMLDDKAKKIVENMPRWEPGHRNGDPIKVQYAIPVRFNLKE